MEKHELAAFLRSRRERISPAEVGLPSGKRRRTPGLRREEVAQLAFISAEYYARLEQARAPRPSREVIRGLVRALRLSDAESDYVHQLAGVPSLPAPGPSRVVRQSILDLIDRLPHAAAIVESASHEIIAWNPLACALMEDFSAVSRRDRNLIRNVFLGRGAMPKLYGLSDAEDFARASAHDLRAATARYPADGEIADLVTELLAGSAQFRELWESHDVSATHALVKTFEHAVVGPITVNCDVLNIADRDQKLVIYTAAPGSASEEAMQLLSVIGTQKMHAVEGGTPQEGSSHSQL